MISLRKLLQTDQKLEAGLLRVVYLLLQGITLHAVEGDSDDYSKFRADMQGLMDGLGESPSADVLLMTTGATLKTLEEYNHRTARHLRVQGVELQNMIAMLTKTVTTLTAGSDRSVTRLLEIAVLVEKRFCRWLSALYRNRLVFLTAGIEDMRSLRMRLDNCLEGIREEASRQKSESLTAVEGLKHEISQTQERVRNARAAPARDVVTGLMARPEAEAAFLAASQSGKRFYAAFFVVDRVGPINSRFGHAVGDRILNLYLDELRKKLSAADPIFRWSGPSFVALLERSDALEKVRDQLRFVVPAKMDKTVELSNRSALLPISASWTVFPVKLPLDELSRELDKFLAAQWQQGES